MPRTIRVHRRPGSSVGVQVACRKSRTLTGGRGCLTIHLAAAGGMFRGRGSTCAAACLPQFVAVRNVSRTQLKSDRMTQNILYIHGAYASPTTFRHMIEHLPDHRAAFADYDCLTNSVEDVVRSLKATAAESFGGEPYSIIARSLGGVVGLRLAADDEPVEQIFTMSTPFGGSHTASLLTLVFFTKPVFADINPRSPVWSGWRTALEICTSR
jgi:pimeloyl-ACP methyl ester carboxylesterase